MRFTMCRRRYSPVCSPAILNFIQQSRRRMRLTWICYEHDGSTVATSKNTNAARGAIEMDLIGAISALRAECAKLDAAIAQFELLTGSGNGGAPVRRSTRGRKSMGAAERREVSERMKKY